MELKELKNKLINLLGLSNSESELVYNIFLAKVSEVLDNRQAIRIPDFGILQRKDEIFESARFSDSLNRTVYYYPSFSEDNSIFLKLQYSKTIPSAIEFNDNIFSTSLGKGIIPQFIKENNDFNDDNDDIENIVEQLIRNSELVDDINLFAQDEEIYQPQTISEIYEEKPEGKSDDDDINELNNSFEITTSLDSEENININNEELEDFNINFEEWEWSEDIKQEIVDEVIEDDYKPKLTPAQETITKSEFSAIEDDSTELFNELEESLKEELESFNEFEEDFVEEDEKGFIDSLSPEESDEFENIDKLLEQMNEEDENVFLSPEDLNEEYTEVTDNTSENNAPLVEKKTEIKSKKENKIGFMAKIKRSLGKLFWILVALFILSLGGGIYYFFFMSHGIKEDEHFNLADSLKQYQDTIKVDNKHTQVQHPEVIDSAALADSAKINTADSAKNKILENAREKKETSLSTAKIVPKSELNKKTTEINKIETPRETKTDVKLKPLYSGGGPIEYRKAVNETSIPNTYIYTDGKIYSVQVSSWKKKDKAEKEVRALKQRGLNAYIVEITLEALRGTWYRVRVGDFKTIDEAKEFSKKNKF